MDRGILYWVWVSSDYADLSTIYKYAHAIVFGHFM